MKILFVLNVPHAIEPQGVMMLIALCRRHNHEVGLTLLAKENLAARARAFQPDVVAYSVIGSEVDDFKRADQTLLAHCAASGRRVFRIMGGPHPTFAPQVLDEMGLDAICQGDGERALPALLARLERNEPLEGIPNIALTSAGAPLRERLNSDELDGLPFPDRELYFKAVPFLQPTGLRSFLTGRGCPYSCSFCYNDAYNRAFAGCGSVLRRRSVENILAEIEEVRDKYPPLGFIRLFHDTFSFRADAWLEEFAEKYPKRIGVPFYCLMRANTFTEETARLLKKAGCYTVAMSIEAGSERVRNGILGRNLSDDEMRRAFDLAHRNGLRIYSNTMVGIPGTTLEDDFESLEFTRSLRPTVPTFSVCFPSRGTKLAEYALENGFLHPGDDLLKRFSGESPLTTHSERDKGILSRIACFGPMYCILPRFMTPVIRRMILLPVPLPLARRLGHAFTLFNMATRVFRNAIPRNPLTLARAAWESIRYFW